MLEDNIGYIAISDFDGDCANEFKTKYKELEKKGITKLIIDIRNNGGGIVDKSLEIANTMIEKGSTLLITKDKKNNEDITKATRELKELTLKMKDSTCISKDNASSRKGISC